MLPTVGYTGEAPPERGALFRLAVYLKGRENFHFSIRKGHKTSCKVEEMVAKAKYIKGCHIFGRNDYATESERLKTREKRGDYRKFFCFCLTLRYKKWVQFCSRYMKGVPLW